MTEHEALIEKLAKWLCMKVEESWDWDVLSERQREVYRRKARRLLKDIPELAFVDRNSAVQVHPISDDRFMKIDLPDTSKHGNYVREIKG